MKFIIKSFVLTILLIQIFANKIHSECDNPCIACQRAVYQLKFQKIADCGSSHCKNTCHKVKDLWNNSPDHVFQPFEKDIFGKCEICFRAGFCSIAECKAQQDVELQYISDIVGKAHLTTKPHDYLGKQEFEQFHKDNMFYDPAQLAKLDSHIEESKGEIKKQIEESVVSKSAKGAIEEVKKVMGNLFEDKTFNGQGIEGKKEINKTEKVKHFVNATKDFVNHVNQIAELSKSASNQPIEEKKKVEELVKSTVKDINKKLSENKKLLKDAHLDKEVSDAVKEVNKELHDVKAKLRR